MKTLFVSSENAEFQVIQSLKCNRVKRNKAKEVFIEGIESIKQAIAAGVEITRIITPSGSTLSSWSRNVIEEHRDSTHVEMAENLYRAICDRQEPSEMAVTAKIEQIRLRDLELPTKPFVLVFDRPSDCGNFGSIIRSANSFNVDAVFVVGHAIDIYDPKVIRSSLGSIFHSKIVPIQSMEEFGSWVADQRRHNGIDIVGTDSTGSVSLPDRPLRKPIAVVLGNEAKGMSVALKELCDFIVSIPISGAVNSLNVSCAGSIFLWDVYRNGLV